MVKARIVIYTVQKDEHYDHDYSREITVTSDISTSDWEEITQADLDFLVDNIHDLRLDENERVRVEYIGRIIPDTIAKLKTYLADEKKKREAEIKKYEEERKQRQLKNAEAALARKKKRLEKLKKELAEE